MPSNWYNWEMGWNINRPNIWDIFEWWTGLYFYWNPGNYLSRRQNVIVKIQWNFRILDIKTQHQRDKDAGNDNVPESQHGKVLRGEAVFQEILWENDCTKEEKITKNKTEESVWNDLKKRTLTFDGCIKRLGHKHHDIGAKHPENVVEEEAAEQGDPGEDFIQRQQLDRVKGECQAEEIVGNPVLWNEKFCVNLYQWTINWSRDSFTGNNAINRSINQSLRRSINEKTTNLSTHLKRYYGISNLHNNRIILGENWIPFVTYTTLHRSCWEETPQLPCSRTPVRNTLQKRSTK